MAKKVDYKKIVRRLVKKSFPRLRRKIIFVSKTKFQIKWYSASITYFGFGAWILVLPLAMKCSKREFESIMAHELAHFEIISDMDFKEKIKFAFKWFTKKGKAWFETAADKYAIEKGYGKGLYSRVKRTERERTKSELKARKRRGYLSSKEIRSYAQKIGKW